MVLGCLVINLREPLTPLPRRRQRTSDCTSRRFVPQGQYPCNKRHGPGIYSEPGPEPADDAREARLVITRLLHSSLSRTLELVGGAHKAGSTRKH